MKRCLLAIVAVASLTGCVEGWEDFELDPYLPTVTFQRLDVLAVDWDGVDADFVFDVHNPNPVDVSMARFDYALAFEQVEWLAGDNPDGLYLPAEDDNELALPVSIEFESLFDMVQAVRGQDDIGFGLDGSFGFDTPVGPVDVPYDEDGGFPAPRRPEFELNRLKLKSLSLQGADMNLKLDVDNDHGSNIFLQDVTYDIQLAGLDVGGGYIAELGEIDGATSGTVNVPITIDFVDAGTALYSVLQGDELEVGFRAALNVDTPFGLVPLEVDRLSEIGIER